MNPPRRQRRLRRDSCSSLLALQHNKSNLDGACSRRRCAAVAAVIVVAHCLLAPSHAFVVVPQSTHLPAWASMRLYVKPSLSSPRAASGNQQKKKTMDSNSRRLQQRGVSQSTAAAAASASFQTKRQPDESDMFLFREMVRHNILTKQQEKVLGNAVQRSIQLRADLDLLLKQKRLEQQKIRSIQWKDDDDDNDDDDLSHLSIYGGGDAGDDFYAADHEIRSFVARSEARQQERKSNTFLSLYSWERDSDNEQHKDDITIDLDGDDDGDDPQDGYSSSYYLHSDLHLLSDQEIAHHLKLPRGRAQLKAILLQGARARNTLIRSNIKLVVGISRRWARMSMYAGRSSGEAVSSLFTLYNGSWDRPSVNEAVQEGILGLATAVERFDPKRGLRFSTYATHWVNNSVRLCFQRASTGGLRVPINYYETRSKFRVAVKRYYETGSGDGQQPLQHQSPPSLEYLAAEIGIAVPRLKKVLKLTQPLMSLDEPRRRGSRIGAGKGGVDAPGSDMLILDTVMDQEMRPEERVEFSLLRQNLENAMATELSPRERDIIRLRLGLDDGVSRTVRQVAEAYGGSLSMSEVRTAETQAFKKLRSPESLATYKLWHYLDLADIDHETITMR